MFKNLVDKYLIAESTVKPPVQKAVNQTNQSSLKYENAYKPKSPEDFYRNSAAALSTVQAELKGEMLIPTASTANLLSTLSGHPLEEELKQEKFKALNRTEAETAKAMKTLNDQLEEIKSKFKQALKGKNPEESQAMLINTLMKGENFDAAYQATKSFFLAPRVRQVRTFIAAKDWAKRLKIQDPSKLQR